MVKHKCWRHRAKTQSLPERADYPIDKRHRKITAYDCVTEVCKACRVCPEEGIRWSLTREDCFQKMERCVKAEKIQWFTRDMKYISLGGQAGKK